MKILFVEDNKTIWQAIENKLRESNYQVDWFWDGEEAIDAFDKNKYDLVILDWMLPWFDWISILDHIRASSEIPVIITTSKSQIEDKKEWFATGADDYLVKPFELDELIIRIENLVKRSKIYDSFKFEDIEIFLKEQKVLKSWKEVKITNKGFVILNYLIENIWTPISRTDLIDYVWWEDGLFTNDDKLDVYISTIRKKTNKNLIKTIKWFGYKIEK